MLPSIVLYCLRISSRNEIHVYQLSVDYTGTCVRVQGEEPA